MTFAVIACSTCTAHWVIDRDHATNANTTTECPGCGTQNTGTQRVLATAPTQPAACEQRGKLLAEKAGYGNEYENNPTYAEAGEQAHDTPTSDRDAFENAVNDTIKQHREILEDAVDKHPIGKHAFEDAIDKHPIGKHAFKEEAEAVLGTVGKNESTPYGTTDNKPFTRHPAPAEQVKNNTDTISEINDTQSYSNTGLTPTQQRTTGTATVSAHQPVTDLWGKLATQPAVQNHFINATATVTNREYEELETVLNTAGILDTPMNGHGTRGLFHNIRRQRDEPAAWKRLRELLQVLQELGTGHSTVDDIHAAARLFQFAVPDRADANAPTIAVELNHDKFKHMPRSQRIDVCEVIGILSKAFDVRLECTRITQAYLRHHHREHLPGVSEWENTHRGEQQVDEALTNLNADSTHVQILRALADQPGETLSYKEVYANVETSPARARQCISTLKDYTLVESFNPDTAKKLSLLNDGREVLTHMDEQYGQQTTLENSVSGTQKYPRQSRVNRDAPDGDRTGTDCHNNSNNTDTAIPQGSRGQQNSTGTAGTYRTAYLNRADHAAIAACGVERGTVTVMDDGVDGVDSNTRFVSFDDDRGEAVVSVHATTPVDYSTSLAVALASPKFVDAALDEMTLEAVLDEVPGEILRNGRQIGYLTDDVLSDPVEFRNTVVQWGEDVEKMTRELYHGKYDDRNEKVSEILRDAHGLAGSVVHLLDAAGVDLVRDVRVPGTTNSEKLEALAVTMRHSVFIQSRYRSRVAYRELFEDREEKRASKLGVEVDAADPYGSLIGSIVVRGKGAERVTDALEEELSGCEPHEDAAEFSVPVPFRVVSREMVATTATRVLSPKNLRVTRDIVSVLDAVVDSPFGVAAALQQLAPESEMREMDAAELRYALRQLTADDVLSEFTPNVAEIVMVLVDADRELLQKTVAERADVSEQTVRNHADVLEATGLVRRGPDGSNWRFAVSFRSERGDGVVPVTCSKSVDSVVGAVIDVVEDGCSCGDECVEAVRRTGRGGECRVGRWCRVGAVLCGRPGDNDEGSVVREVVIGESPCQAPIVDSSDSSDGDGPDSEGGSDSNAFDDDRDDGCGSDDAGDGSVSIDVDFSGVSIAGATGCD